MNIIVGLGNPGKKYENTRHNAGFIALDFLAEKYNLKWRTEKNFQAMTAKQNDLLLVKPLTYMNNSGQAVSAVLNYYKLLPRKFGFLKEKDADLKNILTVVHDDLDIPLGEYKTSFNSGSAGHKGVQSIINHLKTKMFSRVRIGIKPDFKNKLEKEEVSGYVLKKFSKEDLNKIKDIIKNLEI